MVPREEDVVAHPPANEVAPGSASEHVGTGTAEDPVAAPIAGDAIRAGTPDDRVVPKAALQPIGALGLRRSDRCPVMFT